MIKTVFDKVFLLWAEGRGPYILLGLLFFSIFVAPPLIMDRIVSDITMEFAFIIILITGVFSITQNMPLRIITILVCCLSFFFKIAHHTDHKNTFFFLADNILSVINLSIFSGIMIRRFLMTRVKLKIRIAAAVSIYLLFGMLWAKLFNITDILNPAAFSVEHNKTEYTFIYFSFVTLVTLGYGDIVPVSLLARSLSILEGIVGQLYVVILISSLVSEFSAYAVKTAREEVLKATDELTQCNKK